MTEIEKLKAKHKAEMDALIAKQFLLETMEIRPWVVTQLGDHTHLNYAPKIQEEFTLEQVLAIWDQFPDKLSIQDRKGHYRSFRPEVLHKPRGQETEHVQGEYNFVLRTMWHQEGSIRSEAVLQFWANYEGKLMHVGIRLPRQGHFIPELYEERGYGHRLLKRHWNPNKDLKKLSDVTAQWASFEGPIKTYADILYGFNAVGDYAKEVIAKLVTSEYEK